MNLEKLYIIRVLHQTTTFHVSTLLALLLYIIRVLHQTTTWRRIYFRSVGCILLEFYIKPQLLMPPISSTESCILLEFYIKPQPLARAVAIVTVVYY